MPENDSPEEARQKLDAKLTGLERLRLAGLVTEERYVVMREQLITAAGGVAPPAPPAHTPPTPPPPAHTPPAPSTAAPSYTPPAGAVPPPSYTPPPSSPAPTYTPPAAAAPPPPAPSYAPPPSPDIPGAAATPITPPPQPTVPPPSPAWSVRAAPSAPATPPPAPSYAAPAPPQPQYAPPTAPAPPYAPPPAAAAPAWPPAAPYGAPPPAWPGQPGRPPAPPRPRSNVWLVAAAAALVLLGGGTFAGVVLHAHNASSPTANGSTTNPSSASDTSSSTPAAVQHADMNKVRQAYLASMNPVGQSWINLDNAIKSAESKPCSFCPPGTFDITPVIPKIEAVIVAYHNSIDELSVIEAELEGQPSSDVGALINGMRRALVAFENELTSGSSSGTLASGLAGTLVQSNKDASDLDNVVRKEIGLTPGAPIT